MTSDDTHVTLPTIALQYSRFDLRINTGELLFPVIVLLFCGAYYVGTRGLPAESMLYAEPLLYATAILAVITIFGHAVSIKTETDVTPSQSSTESVRSVVWGVENTVAEQEHPKKNELSEAEDNVDKTLSSEESDRKSFFNLQASIALVFLITGYMLSLNIISFAPATVLFLAATVYLFGERDFIRIVVYSVGFTGLLWVVFINWLQVPLP